MNEETILIVDDDQDIVEFISVLLAKEQYRSIQASSAEEALGHLENGDIQLIVLDVMMPVIDGMELCRRIRRVNRFRSSC
ncbi:CAI-1 autoinducer sensor kinase/phosphatase CqsS [compost metagenome]